MLGLSYAEEEALEANQADLSVLVDFETGGVRVFESGCNQLDGTTIDPNSDTEADGDGNRFDETLEFCSLVSDRPLIMSVDGAKKWDLQFTDMRPPTPTGPVSTADIRSMNSTTSIVSIISSDLLPGHTGPSTPRKERDEPEFGSFAYEWKHLPEPDGPVAPKKIPRPPARRRKGSPPPPVPARNWNSSSANTTVPASSVVGGDEQAAPADGTPPWRQKREKQRSRSVTGARDMEENDLAEPVTVQRRCLDSEISIYGTKEHYLVSGLGSAPVGFEHDWTETDNNGLWQFLNNKRYDLMKEVLQRGEPVQFKSSGGSLAPLVYSGDICFIWPIIPGTTKVQPGDVVFCEVQPKGRYYVHLVWKKSLYRMQNGVEKEYYVIGNNRTGDKERIHGWCYNEHIFGILVKAQRGAYRRPDFT